MGKSKRYRRITPTLEAFAKKYHVKIPSEWYAYDDDVGSVQKDKNLSHSKLSLQEEERCGAVYGGCEGPDAMYVKLISSDGHEFIVKREHALTSGTIKAMLSGPGQFAENETNEIHFREIPLVFICSYYLFSVNSSFKLL